MKPCTILVTDTDGNQSYIEKGLSANKMGTRKVSFSPTSSKQSFLKIFHEAQKQIEQMLKIETNKSSSRSSSPSKNKSVKKFSVGNISSINQDEIQSKPETKTRRKTISDVAITKPSSASTASVSQPIRIRKTDYYNDKAIQRESLETIRLTQLIAQREVHPDYWIGAGETLAEEDIEGIFDVNSTMTGYKKEAKSLSDLPSETNYFLDEENSDSPPPRPPKKVSVPTLHVTRTGRRLSDNDLKHSPWKQYTSSFSHLFEEKSSSA